MSTNVVYAGFSIKLNEEDQSEKRLKEIAKSFNYLWSDNWEWDDIMYNEEKFKNNWKPHMGIDGTYGFIWVTHYEYDVCDIEYKQPISAMGRAFKDYVDQTMIIPKEEIKTFVLMYYNGSDDPFKF
jgi:hypothetical protein